MKRKPKSTEERTQAERDNAKVRAAHEKELRAEKRMRRAFKAWEKARGEMDRLCKRLDKRIGGSYDVRDLSDPIEEHRT